MDSDKDHKSKPEEIIPGKEQRPEEERRERGKGKDLEQGSEQIDDEPNWRNVDTDVEEERESYDRIKKKE